MSQNSDARDAHDTQAARIAALEAELQALRSEMQDFTYTVSHDLRASLRHVVSYVHLVQEDGGAQLSPDLQGFLQTAADSARHMGLLMDGLVELARLGTVALDCTPLSLQSLVQEAVNRVRAQYPERQVEWNVAPDLPDVIGDAALLRLALGHLLDNAVKFTGSDSHPQACITVHARRVVQNSVQGAVELTVQDNGVGFNPALRSKLFHPFGRLHSVRQFPGIGIGLAQTHKIAARLGGSVDIDAVVDGGCSVRLLLPAS